MHGRTGTIPKRTEAAAVGAGMSFIDERRETNRRELMDYLEKRGITYEEHRAVRALKTFFIVLAVAIVFNVLILIYG